MNRTLIVLSAIAAVSSAQAQTPTTTTDTQYFTIKNVETHEIPTPETSTIPTTLDQTDTDPSLYNAELSIGGVDISDIINLGKTLWTIVQANKPVSNVTTNTANAIPKGITDWTSLAGWEAPQTHTFQSTFTNGYGMTVVQFQYRVTFTPGGTYDRKGRYLANVTVTPADVYVAWGYTFNAQVTIPSITNAGTAKSPLAAAEVLVQWTVDTMLTHEQQSADYYVRGDGDFESLQ